MNKFVKIAAATAMTGALALTFASPSEARNGRNAAAIGGFAAGAVVGAAVANSANGGYYDRGYYNDGYYDRGYAYESGYAYEPVYSSPRYAPVYDAGAVPAYPYESAPRYYSRSNRAKCGGSPGSPNYRPCNNQ